MNFCVLRSIEKLPLDTVSLQHDTFEFQRSSRQPLHEMCCLFFPLLDLRGNQGNLQTMLDDENVGLLILTVHCEMTSVLLVTFHAQANYSTILQTLIRKQW